MEFGCHLPIFGPTATRANLLTFAREMEQLGYESGKQALTQQATDHVVAVRASKKQQVETHFRTLRDTMETFDPTSEFRRVDFPAFVYPTSATVVSARRRRALRCVARVRPSCFSSCSSLVIRR